MGKETLTLDEWCARLYASQDARIKKKTKRLVVVIPSANPSSLNSSGGHTVALGLSYDASMQQASPNGLTLP